MVNPVQTITQNVDKRMVVSMIAATAIISGAAFLAVKSGIKPLAKAATKIK